MTQFYVSVDDDLMRIFGGDRVKSMMTTLKVPDDVPIEAKMVSKAIGTAQKKVEGHNFDIRKHLLEYDDVANKQREIIYEQRKKILNAAKDDNKAKAYSAEVQEKIAKEIEIIVLANVAETISKENKAQIIKEFATIIPFDENSIKKIENDVGKISDPQKLIDLLTSIADQLYKTREKQLGEKVSRDIEKFASLSVIDTLWIEHLDALDDLREGIGLRAAGQRDPLVEYKQEAFNLFEKLTASIDSEITRRIFKVQVRRQPAVEKLEEQGVAVHPDAQIPQVQEQPNIVETQKPTQVSPDKDPNEMTDDELDAEIARLEAEKSGNSSGAQVIAPNNPMNQNLNKPIKITKIGRNDPCPCGSGLKWKKCGFINSSSHKG